MLRVFIVLMLSCLPVLASAQSCKAGKPERFEAFFGRFQKDEAFAKGRTRYPLAVVVREPGANGEEGERSQLSAQDDAESPVLREFIRDNELAIQSAKASGNSALVMLYRKSPAWRLVYRFGLEGGCWYLQQIDDQFD